MVAERLQKTGRLQQEHTTLRFVRHIPPTLLRLLFFPSNPRNLIRATLFAFFKYNKQAQTDTKQNKRVPDDTVNVNANVNERVCVNADIRRETPSLSSLQGRDVLGLRV